MIDRWLSKIEKEMTYEPRNTHIAVVSRRRCPVPRSRTIFGKVLYFGQPFRKTLLEWIMRRVTGVLPGRHNVSLPLGFWSPKKPGWITVILQIFGALKFRQGAITERSVYFKFRCSRMLPWPLDVFSYIRCLYKDQPLDLSFWSFLTFFAPWYRKPTEASSVKIS